MTDPQTTLYQILAVSPDASAAAVRAGYEAAAVALRSQKDGMRPEDFDRKVGSIHLAYRTLASSASRAAYDAKLARLQSDGEASARQGGCLVLPSRAMALNSDRMSLGGTGAATGRKDASASRFGPLIGKVLAGLGVLFVFALVAKLAYS